MGDGKNGQNVAPAQGFKMLTFFYVVLFVGVPTVTSWALQYATHGTLPIGLALTALFCVINTLIAVWEISLHLNVDWIREAHAAQVKDLDEDTWVPCFFFEEVSELGVSGIWCCSYLESRLQCRRHSR